MEVGLGEAIFRLFLAIAFGGAVGYEREKEHMAAGLRTHILVCLGSTLAILAGLSTFPNAGDISRLAQGLITGIGFLGAGTILHYGGHVRGLTTAASIWMVCLIGIAVGFGYYMGALIATVATTLLLLFKDQSLLRER